MRLTKELCQMYRGAQSCCDAPVFCGQNCGKRTYHNLKTQLVARTGGQK